ncbi:hypothetical protein FRC07_000417, partial [Ceratobasidium sp. 392]
MVLCTDFGCCLLWCITLNNVPPELVINADQTGVCFLGTRDWTWDVHGASQVAAVTSSRAMLLFQAIYKGKTENSLPSKCAQKDGEEAGFLFTPGGDKHWSTLPAMKTWVN